MCIVYVECNEYKRHEHWNHQKNDVIQNIRSRWIAFLSDWCIVLLVLHIFAYVLPFKAIPEKKILFSHFWAKRQLIQILNTHHHTTEHYLEKLWGACSIYYVSISISSSKKQPLSGCKCDILFGLYDQELIARGGWEISKQWYDLIGVDAKIPNCRCFCRKTTKSRFLKT